MRCPSCGTENAPDSRFCGGCGARLSSSAQGVAPTQKISDDASYPQRPATASGGRGAQVVAPPSAAPRLVPPTPYAPSGPSLAQASAPPPPRAISSAPPGAYANPPATTRASNGSARHTQPPPRAAQAEEPSLSMPMVARRPWGLIIVILLVDLGLAVAGGWMLNEGINGKPSAGSAAPRSSAIAIPPSELAAGAALPNEPRIVAESAGTAAGAAAAPPAQDPAPAATTAPAPGAATGPAPGVTTGPAVSPAGTRANAAGPADKPSRRHRTPPKKPGGAAATSGPVDPYEPATPGRDALPPGSR
jgi:hypothetical protein